MGRMSGVRDQMNNQVNCVCILCGQSERLFRCGRCRQTYYCSKEHQREHWKTHRLECVENTSKRGEQSLQQVGGRFDIQKAAKWVDTTSDSASSEQGHVDQVPTRAIDRNSAATSRQSVLNNEPQHIKESFVLASDELGNNNSFETQHDHTATALGPSHRNHYENSAGFHSLQSTAELRNAPTTVEELGHYSAAMPSVSPVSSIPLAVHPQWNLTDFLVRDKQVVLPPFRHNSVENFFTEDPMKRNTAEWMLQVCQFVVRDLDTYGVCVVDNFLGRERGEAILKTAESMYNSGVFREGEVVSAKLKTSRNIRGDKITWVDGTEPTCAAVSYLISLVDSVIMGARKMKNNGKFGQYQISGRTKAMVACYPGNGTHYVKHVDNPNRDGRCITSIYYLNKDWDVKVDGGLLRIFPEGWTNQVADIEPIFDRMIFFWSDRRNPHEVQPAFRTRYAITLWYFDGKEREEARLRHQKDYGVQSVKSSTESSS